MPDLEREPAGASSFPAPPGSRGASEGQGMKRRDAVAEVSRSEVTRLLVKMLNGATTRLAERRERARRSSHRRRRDESSSSSTTDVSRSEETSALEALLDAFRATLTPSSVRNGPKGIDPRTRPTPVSKGGERSGVGSRELPRGIDPGFRTQRSLATGTEAEGWPNQETSPAPTRVVPTKIVVNHPYFRMMFDFETNALDNKSVKYTLRQARILGRRKKNVSKSLGVLDKWDGSSSAKTFQLLLQFNKACDEADISEGEAFFLLKDQRNPSSRRF